MFLLVGFCGSLLLLRSEKITCFAWWKMLPVSQHFTNPPPKKKKKPMDRRKVSNGGILLHDDSLGPRSVINPVGEHQLAWPQFGPNLESQHREQLLCREGECLYEHQKPLRVPAPLGLTWILAIALIQRYSENTFFLWADVGSCWIYIPISPSSVVHPKGAAAAEKPNPCRGANKDGEAVPKAAQLKAGKARRPSQRNANAAFLGLIYLRLVWGWLKMSNQNPMVFHPFFSQQSPNYLG